METRCRTECRVPEQESIEQSAKSVIAVLSITVLYELPGGDNTSVTLRHIRVQPATALDPPLSLAPLLVRFPCPYRGRRGWPQRAARAALTHRLWHGALAPARVSTN
eukprot:scaffold18007_cov65-Phaeocystis_antarctica.AAC.2